MNNIGIIAGGGRLPIAIGDNLIKKNFNVSPFSRIAGTFILNSIISEVAELAKNEKPFPFYISGNMPNAERHNSKLMKKYIIVLILLILRNLNTLFISNKGDLAKSSYLII